MEPFWNRTKPTRHVSAKQEKGLAKKFGGKTTPNSGAVFGQNDIHTPQFELEAKSTAKDGYRISVKELSDIASKCRMDRIPLQIIEFSEHKKSYVIMSLEDFEQFINKKE